jgi:hypothetical protein
MTDKDIRVRVARLDELAGGLAKEISLINECDDPLLYRERLDYRTAIRQALDGVETGRIVLVKARQRLEGLTP